MTTVSEFSFVFVPQAINQMASSWACPYLTRLLYWLVISSDKDKALKAGSSVPWWEAPYLRRQLVLLWKSSVRMVHSSTRTGASPTNTSPHLKAAQNIPRMHLRGSRIKGVTESTWSLLRCTMSHLPLPPPRPSAAPVTAPSTSHEDRFTQSFVRSLSKDFRCLKSRKLTVL